MNVDVSTGLGSRFAEMKRFVRFSTDDESALRAFAVDAEPHLRTIANHFYDRIREHEGTYAVFRSEEQLRNMPNILEGWLRRILQGPYDEGYARQSEAIGHVHVRVGLPQHFMFTAMALFREDLGELARARADGALTERAVHRILDIELALMNGAYRRAMTERATRIERESQAQILDRLELNARRFVRAVDVAGSIIVGLTADGSFCIFNREAERVTGFALADLEHLDVSDLFVDMPDDASFGATFAELTEHDAPALVDVQAGLRTKNGGVRRFHGRLSHHPGSDGDEAITIITGLDVTEQQALRRRVAQSERLAAVGHLAAGLAHEVRNPLNGAQLHLTFARRSLDASAHPEEVEALDVIDGELHRLGELVSEFLEFARPGPLRVEKTSLNAITDTVVAATSVPANVRLRVELLERDVALEVDGARVGQALSNLIENAVDAVAEHGGTVTVRLYREPWHVVAEVVDDGPGIPDESPVFDAFYTTKPKGTGMGLAVAHRILRDHDGSLETRRRSGQTAFVVRLPLTQLESEATDV